MSLRKSFERRWEERWPHGYSPGRGHYVVFLGKTLNSHSVLTGPGQFDTGGNHAMD